MQKASDSLRKQGIHFNLMLIKRSAFCRHYGMFGCLMLGYASFLVTAFP
jgi:hypothetical protein